MNNIGEVLNKKVSGYFKEKCRYNSWKIKENPMPRRERVGFKVASFFK